MKISRGPKQFLSSARFVALTIALMIPFPLLHAEHMSGVIPDISAEETNFWKPKLKTEQISFQLPEIRDLGDNKTESGVQKICLNGNCDSSQANHGFEPILFSPSEEPPPPLPEPEAPRGSCKLLAAAKNTVRRVYGNNPYGTNRCGTGVGRSIINAGFKLWFNGLDAYKYDSLLEDARWVGDQKWTNLNIKAEYPPGKLTPAQVEAANRIAIAKAPPGSVLVFSGPCTPGKKYPQPRGRIGCPLLGDRLGHVTIKGDDGFFYTDGRTAKPAIRDRYLVSVWVPPHTDEEKNCNLRGKL